jgi:NAD+ synthase
MESSIHNDTEKMRLHGAHVRRLLVQFIQDETTKAGFSCGIVGLSGGIDSAVSASLTAEALGKSHTIALLMPYKTSNPKSIEDATAVVSQLGVRSETIDITSMVDSYCDAHKVVDPVRRGNVMARMRMILLYDVSAREKGLVIGTSNKTEILIGYGTLHGDMASAINPIGDLYKTQVRQLAQDLRVPEAIIRKEPSADLWEGQTDEQELGISYDELDALLFAMIDEQRGLDELVRIGFPKPRIEKVHALVRKSQFKRRPSVIAKVSHRTVNIDFRYARDWGM